MFLLCGVRSRAECTEELTRHSEYRNLSEKDDSGPQRGNRLMDSRRRGSSPGE